VKITFTLLWNCLTLLSLVHIQSLQSSSCQFVYLNETSLCFLCISSNRSRLVIFSAANKANHPIPVKSPIIPKCHLQTRATWVIHTALIPYPVQVKDSCQLTSASLYRTMAWEKQAPCQGKPCMSHASHLLPSKSLFLWVVKHFISIQYQLFLPPLLYFANYPHLPASLQACPITCVAIKPGLRLAVIDFTLVRIRAAQSWHWVLRSCSSVFIQRALSHQMTGYLFIAVCLAHKEKQLIGMCVALRHKKGKCLGPKKCLCSTNNVWFWAIYFWLCRWGRKWAEQCAVKTLTGLRFLEGKKIAKESL